MSFRQYSCPLGLRRTDSKATTQLAIPQIDIQPRITVSIGIAQYRSGENLTEIQARADNALYEAKRSGRNRIEGVAGVLTTCISAK